MASGAADWQRCDCPAFSTMPSPSSLTRSHKVPSAQVTRRPSGWLTQVVTPLSGRRAAARIVAGWLCMVEAGGPMGSL